MRVQFNVSGYDLAPSLRTLIEQHFRFAVSPFKSALRAVHVTLSDVAGAGAGAAKRCHADLQLRNGRLLTIARRDARTESAVQRVSERIVRAFQTRRMTRRAKSVVSCGA